MSKNYEIIGGSITFGMGMEIKLSPAQAEVRSASLQKKKDDIYQIVSPIQFKQGEIISVASEGLNKSLLERLKEIPDKNSNQKSDKNSDKIIGKNTENKKPIKKDEAEKTLLEIQKNKTTEVDKSQDNSDLKNAKDDTKKDAKQDDPNEKIKSAPNV